MGESVLVTGATGFVGRHLVPALRDAGYDVQTHSSAVSDIGQELSGYIGITHVFHLAGRTFVPDSWRQTDSFYKVNVQGTVNVMELCRQQKASVTVLSSYVYGIPKELPIREDHPLAAVNPYAHTKILAEDVARFYETQFGIRVAVVRPFNLYGRGQDRRFLIPQLIHACYDAGTAALEVADLEPRRDYLHVQDLTTLLLLMLATKASGTYNAGYGASISVRELAATIRQVCGSTKTVSTLNRPRPNEIPDVVADINRARSAFGWIPRVTLSDGIRDIIEDTDSQVVGRQ